MILKIHNTILHIELEEEFSSPVDCLIVVDDVNLIMRQPEAILKPKKTPPEDWKKIIENAKRKLPKKLGSIVIAQGKEATAYGKSFPVAHLFIAIVYNFELSPPCQKKFLEKALKACFKKAATLNVTNLALNLIGSKNQGISLQTFVQILSLLCQKHIKKESTIKSIFLLLSSEKELNLIMESLSSLKAIRAIMPEASIKQNFLKM